MSTKNISTIYDKTIIRPVGLQRVEVSLSAFAYLFSECVQYHQTRVSSFMDIEKKLSDSGYDIGLRVVELIANREKINRREMKIVNMLQFVSQTCWKHLFNKAADNLERSTENEDEYMIHENFPITNYYVDSDKINCASFIAGIIAGILDSSRFNATVTAHLVDGSEGNPERTIFLVKFSSDVVSRDKKM